MDVFRVLRGLGVSLSLCWSMMTYYFIVQDDKLGETPLICASVHGYVSVCEVLLEQGATVDFQNKVSYMLGHWMCEQAVK